VTVPMTACEWRIGPAGLDELRIVERAQRDGSVFYAVTRGGWVANRGREWEYEVQPSSRDAAFIARTRFAEWEDAAWLAQYMAVTLSAWESRRLDPSKSGVSDHAEPETAEPSPNPNQRGPA
jgi:hypothetical protein